MNQYTCTYVGLYDNDDDNNNNGDVHMSVPSVHNSLVYPILPQYSTSLYMSEHEEECVCAQATSQYFIGYYFQNKSNVLL